MNPGYKLLILVIMLGLAGVFFTSSYVIAMITSGVLVPIGCGVSYYIYLKNK